MLVSLPFHPSPSPLLSLSLLLPTSSSPSLHNPSTPFHNAYLGCGNDIDGDIDGSMDGGTTLPFPFSYLVDPSDSDNMDGRR